MGKVNRFLLMAIAMVAIMLAAVGVDRGMKYYEARIWEKERVERYEQAYADVAEIRLAIEELSQDQSAIEAFIEENREYFDESEEDAVFWESGMEDVPEEPYSPGGEEAAEHLGEGEPDGWMEGISGEQPEDIFGDQAGDVSENAITDVSGNQLTDGFGNSASGISGNQIVDGDNAPGVSGNGIMAASGSSVPDISGNGIANVSGNGIFNASGNQIFDVYGNPMTGVSGNFAGSISGNKAIYVPGSQGMVQTANESTVSGNTLQEKRKLRGSYMETRMQNQVDIKVIADKRFDFSGMSIACLGDSITQAANLDNMENYQQYSYPSRLKELLGAKSVTNLGIGGSSIGRYWENAFVDRFQEIPEDTDLIIVMGGTNDGFCLNQEDFGTMDERKPGTFIGDLDELMRGLKEKYPEADIVFATPLPNILHDVLRKERDYLLTQTVIASTIRRLAGEYGIWVIDLYNSNVLDTHDAAVIYNYMPDGVHCNEDGYVLLAERIAAELIQFYESREEENQETEDREADSDMTEEDAEESGQEEDV